jgi:hypothetical protein
MREACVTSITTRRGERRGQPRRTVPAGDMRAIELPRATWRAVIAVLRETGLPSMLEHANHIERLLMPCMP